MRTERQTVLGLVLIGFGVLVLIDRLWGIEVWRYVFPLLLIGLGVWALQRPRTVPEGTSLTQKIAGDLRGSGVVADQDALLLMGDVKLDWRTAVWPDEPVNVKVSGLFGDVEVRVPAGVGVFVDATALAGSVRLGDQKRDVLASQVEVQTEGYAQTGRQLRVQTLHVFGDVKVLTG